MAGTRNGLPTWARPPQRSWPRARLADQSVSRQSHQCRPECAAPAEKEGGRAAKKIRQPRRNIGHSRGRPSGHLSILTNRSGPAAHSRPHPRASRARAAPLDVMSGPSNCFKCPARGCRYGVSPTVRTGPLPGCREATEPPIMMPKADAIAAIATLNPSANPAFLALFSCQELNEYLHRLRSIPGMPAHPAVVRQVDPRTVCVGSPTTA